MGRQRSKGGCHPPLLKNQKQIRSLHSAKAKQMASRHRCRHAMQLMLHVANKTLTANLSKADLLTVILAAYSSSEPTTHDPTVKLQLRMTTPRAQMHSFPTAMQTVRSSHEQRRPSRLPKELFLLSLPHFKLGLKNYT